MKKLICFVLTLAIAGIMVSCGSGGASSPGKAAKQYAEYMAAGDYDKFVDGIYIAEDTPADEAAQGKAMLKSLLAEKGAETLAEKGGIKSIEVISEEIAPDGGTAEVVLKYTYGSGETSEEPTDMRLDASGKWKMEIKK